MDALSGAAVRALDLLGIEGRRAGVHDGRPRAGVLPDRPAVLLRAPRPADDRAHALRRQAPQGPGARRPLLRLDPRAHPRLHARGRAASWPSSASRSRPATTRSRPTSTRSRRSSRTPTSAPTTSMLTMEIMQNTARRYGLVCLLHEKPFAGVNGSGKHNNWSMATDAGENLLDPGDTPHENLAVPVLLRGGHPGRRQAPGAAARVDRERRQRPPPGRQRGAAGDHLDLPRRPAGEGLQRDRARAKCSPPSRARSSAWARRCCRRCRCTAATATAPARSPSPATSSSSARSARAPRRRSPTRCSTRSWRSPWTS